MRNKGILFALLEGLSIDEISKKYGIGKEVIEAYMKSNEVIKDSIDKKSSTGIEHLIKESNK